MRFMLRNLIFVLILISFCMFTFGCSTKKEAVTGEPLKLAAKAFQPTMMNLGKILKEGNIAVAKDTLNLLNKKFAAIDAAGIPARLSENADKVQSQIEALSNSLDDLTSALTEPELTEIDSTILNKFTTVQTNFSQLGASLRVKIPELVSFHDVLHIVWHDYYPNDQIDSIKAIVPQFKEKAAALNNIQWPDVLSGDAAMLSQKVKNLQKAVDDLEAACQGGDVEAIKKATEAVHENYAAVNKML
jgi:ABC-type transporter Mla subunit MlaD